jgi:hypothetical protein
MFRALNKLFRKEEAPKEPFVDPVLGQFTFEHGLGWKAQVVLGERQAELVLGSDGEAPSGEMLQSAKTWLDQWPSQHPKIIEYIGRELRGWSDEPNLPVPDKLEVESINLLWSDKPTTSMIYLHYPGDDIRVWHVTFDGFEPKGFAYDD